jgi:hypothetical protein
MLDLSPAAVKLNLLKYRTRVGIIARQQGLTDLPEFAWLAGINNFDGRPFSAIRGVGATTNVPTTAIGEELVMDGGWVVPEG